MALEWMPRDNGPKDHRLHSDIHFGTDADAPCVVYEKRPLKDASGKIVESLYTAWIRLNNPKQFNSYTTEMVKGVIAAFENASLDRSVVSVVTRSSRRSVPESAPPSAACAYRRGARE